MAVWPWWRGERNGMNKPTTIHHGHRQRLRERFRRDGLASLTDREALELLLTYAIPQRDVSPDAAALLERFGSLSGVLEAEPAALTQVAGIGENAATLLTLLPQLLGRYERSRLGEKPMLSDPAGAAAYAASLFAGVGEERAYLVCLDAGSRVRQEVLLARGTLDGVSLSPREVAEQALRCRAHAALLAHNHPGGTTEPSREDIELTRRVLAALAALDIRLLDHVIVSDAGVYSMAQGGLIVRSLPGRPAALRECAVGAEERLQGLGWE